MGDPFALAACVGRGWWPWAGTATDQPHLWTAAANVCERCPARAACLAFAMETRNPSGMWGGLRLSGSNHPPLAETDRHRVTIALSPLTDTNGGNIS
jgi:hypothetical protein